jgi:3-hydroxyisobutyrate dehydrogenase-like beta-hydroxyacid dehydrogenase
MADVAVLGTGRMGSAMARRVAEAGHRITLWNRTAATAQAVADALAAEAADAGRPALVTVATRPADAVRGQDVVLSVFADGDTTRTVLLDTEVLAALAPGRVVCDLATSGVAVAWALSAALGAAGVHFVDAPVSGSVPAVTAGTLLVMAAGDPVAIESARPVLDAFARRIVRVGDAGAGQAMKLAVNLVVHDLNAALAEALILAEKAGIARESAYDVLADSVVGAPFVGYKRAAFLDPSTPVAMSLDLVLKDLRLITALAQSLEAPSHVTTATQDAVEAACRAGFGAADMAALSHYRSTDHNP